MNRELPSASVFINSWKLALIILVLAAVLRLWGAFDLNEYIEDETLHVSYAKSLGTYGTTANWGWHHPQLSGLIVYGTIRLFGDNPVGWRSSNVFFGTASVALIFLIGRLLYPGSGAPILAMSLLAFDPDHIYLSRTTFVEIPVTFFFLLYLYLLLEYTENRKATLPLAGIAMGLTMGTKAYYALALPMSVLYALLRVRQDRGLDRRVIIDFVVALLMLPFAVYFLCYWKWFGRGYTLFDFIRMKMDAVWALQQLTMDNFAHHREFLAAGGKPWEWFIKPAFWGHQRLFSKETGIFLIQCNNPPFRLLTLPSLLVASAYAFKRRAARELLAPALFVGCYLLMMLARRPIFGYSALPLVPFAYLAIARSVAVLAEKMKKETAVYACFLLAVFVWGAYMFPIVSARLVPLAPFRPILSMARFLGNF